MYNMSPKHWGPPLWMFFHTLAEKIDETKFIELGLGSQLFNLIKQICNNLPCPDCSKHATSFLNKVKSNTISTKQDFKMMLFYFHNLVNTRTNKPAFLQTDLSIYATYSLPVVFQQFVTTYNRKTGNLRLMSDSMKRKHIIINVSSWLKTNNEHFN